jgi:hypothetical protein
VLELRPVRSRSRRCGVNGNDATVLDRMFRREALRRRSRIQAALYRAGAHGGAKAAQPLGDNRYRVIGLRGTYFVALFDGETSRCTCASGSFGNPCYHAACAWLRSLAERTLRAAEAPPRVDLEPWLATIAARAGDSAGLPLRFLALSEPSLLAPRTIERETLDGQHA